MITTPSLPAGIFSRRARNLAMAMGTFSFLADLSACAVPPAAPSAPLRVLIEFREPVDGAAPALLARLERLAGVPIHYAAPVSATLHAYRLSCPPADPDCATVIRSLRRDSGVRDISPDQARKPSPASR